MAIEHPEQLQVSFTNFQDSEHLVPAEYKVSKKDICEASEFKYMITLDGNVAPWARGPQILYSESVPIVAESFS